MSFYYQWMLSHSNKEKLSIYVYLFRHARSGLAASSFGFCLMFFYWIHADKTQRIGKTLWFCTLWICQRMHGIKIWDSTPPRCICEEFLKGGEHVLMTAAKMILHDWQRGNILFFVPRPRQDDLFEEPNINGINVDDDVDSNQAFVVPVQKNLFSENELEVATADQFLNTGVDSSNSGIMKW